MYFDQPRIRFFPLYSHTVLHCLLIFPVCFNCRLWEYGSLLLARWCSVCTASAAYYKVSVHHANTSTNCEVRTGSIHNVGDTAFAFLLHHQPLPKQSVQPDTHNAQWWFKKTKQNKKMYTQYTPLQNKTSTHKQKRIKQKPQPPQIHPCPVGSRTHCQHAKVFNRRA